MKTISVTQGSREWLTLRAQHHTASEAPAMMGASRYQQRDQLLHQKHTGITQEVDGHTQALFDRGHATEAAARILLEQDIGEELYSVTALDDAGRLLASFDGINLMGDTGFEHKLWSERLAGQVRTGDLEPHYYWQLEQQILVGGLGKVIFVTSDGTRENWAQMTYCPVPGRAEQLLAGWAQFDADLAAYVPPAASALPAVGRTPEHLPALLIEVRGEVTASNLAEFKSVALAAIRSVNRDLKTDQDFADSAKARKWCEDIEARVKSTKAHAMAQTTSIDVLFKALDEISSEAKDVRIALEKSEKQRSELLRGEIVADGMTALRKHIDGLNQGLGRNYVPMVTAEFGAAIKGKRSFESMRSAVNDELARTKIAAGEVYTRIQCNLKALHSTDGIVLALFPDVATIVLKACDDFAALVQARMAQHQVAEQRRLDAERDRIRAEEQAKAQRELLAQQAEQAQQAQKEIAQAAQAGALHPATAADLGGLVSEHHAEGMAQQAIKQAASSSALPAPTQAVTAPSDDGARINLDAINEHLQKLKVDAAQLASLGFEPVATVKASKLYRASDLAAIRAALIEHLVNLPELQTA